MFTAKTQRRNLLTFIAAFAAVYLVWGSTYLAIKFAIETIPPFFMAGARFVTAGVVMLIWARFAADYERPKAVHWRTSFIVGSLLLLGGNGGVVFAEHYISSSLAALLVATEPFWVVLLSWLWLRASRPNLKVVSGLALGFFGVWMLVSGQHPASGANTAGHFWATLAVIGASFSWAAGSIYGLKAPVPRSALLTAGMQMLSGGIVLFVVSGITGEWSRIDLSAISAASWYGLAYLVVFGSIIGFTAYSWLLKNAEPAMVATYAYVNPIVAIILGWLIAGDSFTGQMLIGAGVIVGSVVLITSNGEDSDKHAPKAAGAAGRNVKRRRLFRPRISAVEQTQA